jgi:hypothetical protein
MLNESNTPPNLLNQYQKFQEDLPQNAAFSTGSRAPQRKNRSITLLVVKTIFFAVLTVVCLGILSVAVNMKGITAIYQGVLGGKTSLESAVALAQARDFVVASEKAQTAVKDFKIASTELEKLNLGPLTLIPVIKEYKTDAGNLANGGMHLSEAMHKGIEYAHSLESVLGKNSSLGFSKLPTEEKRRILSVIYSSGPTLSEIESLLETSLKEIQGVDSFDWIAPLTTRIKELTEKVTKGQKTLASASPLTRLLPAMLGYPKPQNYLFVMQNSDELRPTGGFIGTYGIIQTKDGDITRFDTHDVYHLDMPVKDKVNVTPPEPIKKYLVDKWYLRDANWSPDWPTSAEKILWFYNLENSAQPKPDPVKNFDGVVAITPEVITELMKLTGPITVEGETYTAENFVDLLQYKVEKDFIRLGVPSWHRKETVGQIAGILKQRLLDLPLDQWPELIRLVGDNMARKNVLLYSKNPELTQVIQNEGWNGEIKKYWGDYLMVVDANLAALKTDSVMKRHIDYKLLQEKNGDLTATVTLSYSHEGSPSWKISRYQSFTRIYVPTGSTLIKTTGLTAGSVVTGDESDRTYFGGYFTVPPRENAQLTFQYKLPRRMVENMKKYRNYGILVQKQPGAGLVGLSVDATFNNQIKSYDPVNLTSSRPVEHQFTSTGDLKIDRSFVINF